MRYYQYGRKLNHLILTRCLSLALAPGDRVEHLQRKHKLPPSLWMRFYKAGGSGASPADTPTTYTHESPVSRKRGKRGQVLTTGFSSFPLDDLAHRRIVYARFPRDGCDSVTVFQARPAHGGIA